MTERAWKLAEDEFRLGVDFSTWPMQSGETLVVSNARGALEVEVRDVYGQDVTSEIIDGTPTISPGGQEVLMMVRAGTAGSTYQITTRAPTSDDEYLTEVRYLDVRVTP